MFEQIEKERKSSAVSACLRQCPDSNHSSSFQRHQRSNTASKAETLKSRKKKPDHRRRNTATKTKTLVKSFGSKIVWNDEILVSKQKSSEKKVISGKPPPPSGKPTIDLLAEMKKVSYPLKFLLSNGIDRELPS